MTTLPISASKWTNGKWLLITAVALAAVALLAWRMLRPAEVLVVPVAEQRAERILAITGRTRPKVTVTVLPKVGGQVLSLTKEEGDVVAKGELLVQLDSDAPQAAVEQTRSAVAAQERVLTQAERDYERTLSLQQRGLVTLKDFEDARFALDQARVELDRVRATQREVSTRLGDTRIAAPVGGVVLTRPVDVGQVVDTQSVIYEIAPLDDVEIEAEIDEQFLSEMHEGLRAQIGIPGRARPAAARLSYISPKIDPRIGGAKVRLQFEEPMDDLRAGVTVDINLLVEERDRALTIDRRQILGRDAQSAVLVVREGRVERRAVQYLEWPSSRVIVTSGVRAGDELLAEPHADLVGKRVHGVQREASQLRTAASTGGGRAL